MKKTLPFLFAIFLATFSTQTSFAQCVEQTEPKVLLVGDSWAWFMHTQNIINSVFKTWGHSNYTYVSNSILSENGAETNDFLTATKMSEIQNQLNQNPTIEVVHLSIGGNDFLGDWNINLTPQQTEVLSNDVFHRLDSVIQFIKSCKPGITVFWSGYVYPNFGEVIHDLAPFESNHPFYSTWHGMGDPTFIQINSLLNDVTHRFDSIYASDPLVDFVPCTGLMQYVYGQTSPMSVPPSGTYAPYTQPLPWGDPNYPSPKVSMNDYGFTKDCYHLSAAGYKAFIAYHTQKFYHKFLMDDLYLLSANNSQSGTVSSAGAVDTALTIGESSGEQFATVLSFNTTGMADTTLSKASIFLRRQTLTGTNPVNGSLQVKIKNGNFGTSVDVEGADFSAAYDMAGTPCVFGSNTASGDWITLDLPSDVYPFINNSNATQFIISSPNITGGTMTFYGTQDPDFAPVLNLTYKRLASGIFEAKSDASFLIYPNPSNGVYTIQTNGERIKSVSVTNSLGQVVLQTKLPTTSIDISNQPKGIYQVTMSTENNTSTQRIIKQ